MATFAINDSIDIGTKGYHNASSWQVALDPDFTQIIDESLVDTVNIKTWNSPLPKIDGSGFYADLDNIYCRVKVHIDNIESPWFVTEPKNQNDQEVIMTDVDGNITYANSLEMGLN